MLASTAALLLLMACDASPRASGDASPAARVVDAHLGAGLDAGERGGSDAGLPSDTLPGRCLEGTTTVEVGLDIDIQDSCAVWNSLGELLGTATVTREGDRLEIDFGGGVVFTGTVLTGPGLAGTGLAGPGREGQVELRYVHPHDLDDGCVWEAAETMSGMLREADCTMSLSYDYVESIRVDGGRCATPCSAEAQVEVELTPLI